MINGFVLNVVWTVVVAVYLISSWMLCKSEKGGRCLLGLILFTFYITIAFDAIRLYLADLDSWFPFTEGVFYGTIGSLIVYGVIIWISVFYFIKDKACTDSSTK